MITTAGTVSRGWPAETVALPILLLLIVALDFPIWLVEIVPTQDGPVHLAQADLIAHSGWYGALADPAADFYRWNPRLEPNFAIHVLLAQLIQLTDDPRIAQSLFLSAYGLLWVVASFVAARSETDKPWLPTALLLPIAFGHFIHMGFYNYSIGLPVFLLFASVWRRHGGRRTVAALVATSLALLVLYFTHIVMFVAACLLIGADRTGRALRVCAEKDRRTALLELVREGTWATVAALPTIAFAINFLLVYRGIEQAAPGTEGGLGRLLGRLVPVSSLVSFTSWEAIALLPLLGTMTIFGLCAVRKLGTRDLTWPIFFLLVVVVGAFDLKIGTASLTERLAPFSWFAIVLTIAGRTGETKWLRVAFWVAVVGLCGQSVARSLAYIHWAPALEEVWRIGERNPGGTFANIDRPTRTSSTYSLRVRPLLHANQTAALAAHGAGLSSELPSTRYFGYFPLQYVEARDLLRTVRHWEDGPNLNELRAFRAGNEGAPRVLIVSSEEPSIRRKLEIAGYTTCNGTVSGAITVCAGGAHFP